MFAPLFCSEKHSTKNIEVTHSGSGMWQVMFWLIDSQHSLDFMKGIFVTIPMPPF